MKFIRAIGLKHREFVALLLEAEGEYGRTFVIPTLGGEVGALIWNEFVFIEGNNNVFGKEGQ